MKTLTTILIIALLPVIMMSQVQNIPSVSLKTLDEKNVIASNLIRGDELTLIYFFNENSKDLTDNFDYLENLSKNNGIQNKIKVIAIYNASNGNYIQLKPFLNGCDIDVETYIDINGELQRAMGLLDNSTVLLYGFNPELSARYAQTSDFSNELLNQHVSQLLCDYNSNDDAGKGSEGKSAVGSRQSAVGSH
jgi:hypothetical protein